MNIIVAIDGPAGSGKGTISKLANGEWSKSKTFTDKTEAIAYLEELLSAN